MSTATDVLPEIEEEVTEPDGKKHYVRKDALAVGGIVIALCGKKYIPTKMGNAVANTPMCSKCDELMGFLIMMDNV